MNNTATRLTAFICALLLLTWSCAALATEDDGEIEHEAVVEATFEPLNPEAPIEYTKPPIMPTFVPAPTEIPAIGAPTAPPEHQTQPAATATATVVPDVFPEQLVIYTDRNVAWAAEYITYTVLGLTSEDKLYVYDTIADPGLTQPLNDEFINMVYWDEELQAWHFVTSFATGGAKQLVWRVMGKVDPTAYRDYVDPEGRDIVTVYARPMVEITSHTPSVTAGDTATFIVRTNLNVESVTLVNPEGIPLSYVESQHVETNGQAQIWTILVKFYDAGTQQILARALSELGGSLVSADSGMVSLVVIPSQTEPTLPPSPSEGPTEVPTGDMDSGYVRFRNTASAEGDIGDKVTFNLDIEFAGNDGSRWNYTDEEFYDFVDYVEVQPDTAADPFPFDIDDNMAPIIVRSHNEARDNPLRFRFRLKDSLANGTYTFNFTMRYRLKGEDAPQPDTSAAGIVFVSGAKEPSSTGSGGGGSSGGGSSGGDAEATTAPQAKLIVSGISTDPEAPSAGEKFNVILTLLNTSKGQYVQNIKLSYTTDNDALLPVSGSSSFYIRRIDADSEHELVIPVQAQPNMADAPVKFNVTMEYEDSKVASQSSSQTAVLNIKQVQKIKLDELVLPYDQAYVGQPYTITMNVANSGRTTLYNVNAELAENDMLTSGGSFYCGNMEAGASKQVEMDIYPAMAGMAEGILRLTYEDANGNQTTADTPFSFYAEEETTDEFNMDMEIPEITPEPASPVSVVLARLPYWVYLAGGLFIVLLVAMIGVSARRKSRKAEDEYEDE